MQSALITTKVESSNPAHGEVYSILHYVIVSDLRQIGGFSWHSGPSTNKTDRHDITEILLKVALNTITPTPLKAYRKHINERSQNKVTKIELTLKTNRLVFVLFCFLFKNIIYCLTSILLKASITRNISLKITQTVTSGSCLLSKRL